MTANPTIGCRVFATVCRLTSACPPVRLMSPPRHSSMNEMDWQCLRWVLSLSQCDLLNSQLNSHLHGNKYEHKFQDLTVSSAEGLSFKDSDLGRSCSGHVIDHRCFRRLLQTRSR